MGNYKTKEDHYYFTFGSGQLKDFNLGAPADQIIIEVAGKNAHDARQKVFNSVIGGKFCTSYDHEAMQKYINNYYGKVMSLDQVLSLEIKYKHHHFIEIYDEDDLPDIFRRSIAGGTHLLRSVFDNYLGTYYVWPDGTYCLDTEANEFQWKSDDYYIIRISER